MITFAVISPIPAAIGGHRCDNWRVQEPMLIVARLTKHKTLLNIINHHEILVKQSEPLVEHPETL